MGAIHSRSKSKNPKSESNNPMLAHSPSSGNYAKEIASYQKAVYDNQLPTHQLLNQLSFHSSQESHIQSKYASSISVLNHFWTININTLSDESYASLALQFYTNIFAGIPEAQHLLLSCEKDMNSQSKIFFGMFGWLLCAIRQPESYNLLHKLSILGKLHESMGVILPFYLKMAGAFHKTMSDKYGKYYTLRVRFCFNTLYEIVVNIMTGQDFHSKCMQQKDKMAAFIEHINDLKYCLDDDGTLEYLHLFMKQQLCSELTLYYKDYKIYKSIKDEKERNEKGKEMKRLYIDEGSEREINISCDRKEEFYAELKGKENVYSANVFDNVSLDVVRLIYSNSYGKFKATVQNVYREIKLINADKKITANVENKVTKENYKQNWNFLINRLNQTVPVMEIH